MKDQEFKLPKQWTHWCKKAKLKTKRNDKYHFEGRGFYWRINCYGELQRSCVIEEFNKWGDSLQVTVDRFPRTEDEFVKFVKIMADQVLMENETIYFVIGRRKCSIERWVKHYG